MKQNSMLLRREHLVVEIQDSCKFTQLDHDGLKRKQRLKPELIIF